MNTRIKKLRKALDLTQQEFASRIGTSQNSLAGYETGRRNPSSSVINNICKEFRVNEEWLRTGAGEMFQEMSRDDEIAAFIETVMRDESAEFKRRLIAALAKLNDAGWDALEQFIEDMTRQKAAQRDEYSVAGIPVTALEPWAEQPPAASPPPWDALEETTCFTLPEYRLPMSAGTGQQAGDEWGEPLHLRKRPPRGASYVARISGNSMEPTYHDGARLFIQGSVEVAPGQIGVFFMDGQQWVKELGDGVLLSHNPAYPPRPMTEDIRCQGLVLGVCDESYFE